MQQEVDNTDEPDDIAIIGGRGNDNHDRLEPFYLYAKVVGLTWSRGIGVMDGVGKEVQ